MKKVLKLKDLDCANCAAKMEKAISKIKGVSEVRVNFMAQRMTLETTDEGFDTILEEARLIAAKLEPNMVILG